MKSITVNADFPDLNEIDNYYPPLSERYKAYDLNPDILGTYQIREFPVEVVVYEQDGIYQMTVPGQGLSAYLLPDDMMNFKSTDGNITMNFKQNEGKVIELSMSLANFGISVTGSKN
ncbi:MAG: hypothetical protein HKO90_03295, partial [Flavobacteriaceae bacterium]|nr:hypothetical protein [Flavobacteriaceae bacterium]